METKYLTIDQLVTRWSGAIKRNTLAVWRSQNRGPAYTKAGKEVLYPLEAVEAYEAENTVETN